MDRSAVAVDILAQLALPATRWQAPVLIGLFGLPGAGKTELAHSLARRHPLINLSTDALRLKYHLESGPATLTVMEQVAAQLLPQQISVVFDGIHLGRNDREPHGLTKELTCDNYNCDTN